MEYDNLEEELRKREIEICKKEKQLKDLEHRYKSELERFEREINIMGCEIGDLKLRFQKAEEENRKSLQELSLAVAVKDAYHFCISKIFGGED